ncbi:MAG: DUF1801 domain-containing protein [Gemmatimonadaceae bacterium]|nr:DUF1801 domain-containing protein [Gemmatimonadaceae bacterium]
MVSSRAATVAGYLRELPPERRAVVAAVRKLVRANLPAGFTEVMQYGMISYIVPLARSGTTYNGQPLCYAAIAAQKNAYSLYLMAVYGDPKARRALEDGFKRAGKRLDAGKSCIRFRTLDALPMDVLAPLIGWVAMDDYIAFCARARGR